MLVKLDQYETHVPVIDIHPDDGDQLATLLEEGVLHILSKNFVMM